MQDDQSSFHVRRQFPNLAAEHDGNVSIVHQVISVQSWGRLVGYESLRVSPTTIHANGDGGESDPRRSQTLDPNGESLRRKSTDTAAQDGRTKLKANRYMQAYTATGSYGTDFCSIPYLVADLHTSCGTGSYWGADRTAGEVRRATGC